MERFQAGPVFKAYRLLHHLTLGSRAMEKKKREIGAWDVRLASWKPISPIMVSTRGSEAYFPGAYVSAFNSCMRGKISEPVSGVTERSLY